MEWRDFYQLVELWRSRREQEAPNSWRADVINFENYVLPFFVKRKKLNDPNQWFEYFDDYKEWLLTVKGIWRKESRVISYSTKNHAIKTLNVFLKLCHKKRILIHYEKCPYFPESKIGYRDHTSVIPAEHQEKIFKALIVKHHDTAEFYLVLLKTGLRLSEGLGLSLNDLFVGECESLKNMLPDHLKALGYIALESQVDCKGARKPLKGKHSIGLEHSRTIPIFDSFCFEILARRYNEALKNYQKNGGEPSQYLLFEGLNKERVSRELRDSQRTFGLKPFTAHSCRHTYSTWLAQVSKGSLGLCQIILGHSSIRITMRYVHLAATIQKGLRLKEQLKQPILYKIASNGPNVETDKTEINGISEGFNWSGRLTI